MTSSRINHQGRYRPNYDYVDLNQPDVGKGSKPYYPTFGQNSPAHSPWCNLCNKLCETNEALQEHYQSAHPDAAAQIEQVIARLVKTSLPPITPASHGLPGLDIDDRLRHKADFQSLTLRKSDLDHHLFAINLNLSPSRFLNPYVEWKTSLNWIVGLAASLLAERLPHRSDAPLNAVRLEQTDDKQERHS